MFKAIASFMKNDKILVKKTICDTKTRTLLESFGIFEGAELLLFYQDKSKVIFKIGETKLALSQKIAKEILISEKNG